MTLLRTQSRVSSVECVAYFVGCYYGPHTTSLLLLFLQHTQIATRFVLFPKPQSPNYKSQKGRLHLLGKGWEIIWFFTTMWGICDLIWTASRESCAKISLHKRTFCAASNFVCQCGEPERQGTYVYINYLIILGIN